jgi:hypothetical protein
MRGKSMAESKFRRNRSLRELMVRQKRIGFFEKLEPRLLLTASSIDGRPFVDLGPSDNVALDQPRVTIELINSSLQSLGPSIFATWLLDTGANSTLTFRSAVNEMNQSPPTYQVEGQFQEIGVGGFQLFDISAPYRFDFAGYDGIRNTLLDTRILSDATRDLSLFGPWGIKGMSAMTERYTSLDFTGWINFDLNELFMKTSFPETLPQHNGPRYTLSVDNRVNFSPDNYVIAGDHTPIWADLPFFEAELLNNGNLSSGNFLYDTGAQVSIISSRMAMELGLDSNQDGVLDQNDASFARMETVGGVGGMITVPVFLIDEVHIPTDEGPDLVWTDLQWLVLDIIDEIDGVFGFDNVTSGWIEGFFEDGQAGYIMKSHHDFHGWDTTGEGKIIFDINPEFHSVVDPSGPGASIHQPGGSTLVSEAGHTDTYDIWLTQQPTADVFVSLVVPPAKVQAGLASNPSQTVLQFTPSNWNIPQTVLVAAVDDDVEQSFHRGYVRHLSASADPAYDGVGMPRVIVNIVDNDFPAVMVIRSDGETLVSEDGMTDTYELVLTTPTVDDVTISLEHLANQVTAVSAETGTNFLVFNSSNWNIPQTVLVSAIDDDLVEGPHRAWITHRISTSDPGYQQAFVLQESVSIIDNDEAIPPPRVTDVIVASSTWDPATLNSISNPSPGSVPGYSLVGSQQLAPLAWSGIDTIHVVFSVDVGGSFNSQNVALAGTNLQDYLTSATLSYGIAGTNVATISLSQPIGNDALILAISESMLSASGIPLDGDWTDGASGESGDGSPGGQFNFRFNSLLGDISGDGTTSFADITAVRPSVGQVVQDSQMAFLDVDGNGVISFADLSSIRQNVGSQLPEPPEPPTFGGGGDEPDDGSGGSFNFFQSPERVQHALRRLGFLDKDPESLPSRRWDVPLNPMRALEQHTETLRTIPETLLAMPDWLMVDAGKFPQATVVDLAIESLNADHRLIRPEADWQKPEMEHGIDGLRLNAAIFTSSSHRGPAASDPVQEQSSRGDWMLTSKLLFSKGQSVDGSHTEQLVPVGRPESPKVRSQYLPS